VRKILSFVVVLTGILGVAPALAQQLQALARLDARNSTISERASGDVDIRLALTQGVPFRVFTLDSPTRLVMDFREVEFGRVGADADQNDTNNRHEGRSVSTGVVAHGVGDASRHGNSQCRNAH